MFSEVAEIALVAVRLGQFQQLLKTRVILILNFTRPRAITYTNPPKTCCMYTLVPLDSFHEQGLVKHYCSG